MGTVDDIKAKADIVQIISERITTKKSGKHFKALCPFHGEKTPSFMISPELQIYKCFGCGEGGDVISFLEKYEGMDFNEAIKLLSEKTGIELDNQHFQPKKDKENIIEINTLAAKYYQYLLLKHPAGNDALKYLKEKRKLTVETIEKFGIGYSPEDQNIFNNFFIKKKGISQKDLVLSGIVYERYGRVYDRFSGRVVFPLYDHRGNTVGFSGRVTPNAKPDTAKYINTPETPAYHKSDLLFGLNFTKQEIKNTGYAIITEGELDMVSPYQRGVKNIVAIKGSALTESHARILSRFTKNITLALDADFAGDLAAKRGIEIAQKMGLKVKVAILKGYKDPDEMAAADISKFVTCIEKAVPVYDFIINSALEKYKSDTIEGKVDISKEVIPFLSKIEDEIVKAYYTEILSKKLNIPYESVYSEVEKAKISTLTTQGVQITKEEGGKRENAENTLLILLIQTAPSDISKYRRYFKTSFAQKIVKAVHSYSKKEFDVKTFSDSLPAELRDKFNEVYMKHLTDYKEVQKSALDKEIKELCDLLEMEDMVSSQKALIEEIKESENKGKKEDTKKLQKKLNELIGVRMRMGN